MKGSLVLLAACLALHTSAFADFKPDPDRWEQVVRTDSNTYYLDNQLQDYRYHAEYSERASVHFGHRYADVWEMRCPNGSGNSYTKNRVRYDLDCTTYQVLFNIEYNDEGRIREQGDPHKGPYRISKEEPQFKIINQLKDNWSQLMNQGLIKRMR